jgi:hypothetical protein
MLCECIRDAFSSLVRQFRDGRSNRAEYTQNVRDISSSQDVSYETRGIHRIPVEKHFEVPRGHVARPDIRIQRLPCPRRIKIDAFSKQRKRFARVCCDAGTSLQDFAT